VYFVRHNGGSVWLDPPLGPPWFKHACFESSTSPGAQASLAKDYAISYQALQTEQLTIGVIKSTSVDLNKTCTQVLMETGQSETIHLKIKNNAGYVLGKL